MRSWGISAFPSFWSGNVFRTVTVRRSLLIPVLAKNHRFLRNTNANWNRVAVCSHRYRSCQRWSSFYLRLALYSVRSSHYRHYTLWKHTADDFSSWARYLLVSSPTSVLCYSHFSHNSLPYSVSGHVFILQIASVKNVKHRIEYDSKILTGNEDSKRFGWLTL